MLEANISKLKKKQTKIMPVVEFFFDIISPYSRIQYELLIRQLGHWKSMQLKMTPVSIRKLFEAAQNPSPLTIPKKVQYLFTDLIRVSEYHKIPYAIPQNHREIAQSMGTMKTLKFLTAIQDDLEPDAYQRLIGKFFHHFFHPTEFQNVCEPKVMEKLSLEIGINMDKIEKALSTMDDDSVQNKLDENNKRCSELGAFGLPVTCVHSDEPRWVFGSDRMHILGMLLGETAPPKLQ